MYKYFTKERIGMRSRKGITMMGLVIYITSFLVVTGIVAGITSFFYGNSTLMTQELYSSADFNKLNLYFVKESEQIGNRVTEINGSDKKTNFIKFSNGDKFTFDENNSLLYYNGICLCEDAQKFEVKREYTYGKEVVSVLIGFTNKSYKCKYTMVQ